MSTIATLIDDDLLISTLRKGVYALAACTVIGTAAYIGYRAAEPDTKHLLHHRHPESNEQVHDKQTLNDDVFLLFFDAFRLRKF